MYRILEIQSSSIQYPLSAAVSGTSIHASNSHTHTHTHTQIATKWGGEGTDISQLLSIMFTARSVQCNSWCQWMNECRQSVQRTDHGPCISYTQAGCHGTDRSTWHHCGILTPTTRCPLPVLARTAPPCHKQTVKHVLLDPLSTSCSAQSLAGRLPSHAALSMLII